MWHKLGSGNARGSGGDEEEEELLLTNRTNRERRKIISWCCGGGTCAHSRPHLLGELKGQDFARARQTLYYGATSYGKHVNAPCRKHLKMIREGQPEIYLGCF